MKAAAVKSNKSNESRAAANAIFQKKSNPKGALRFGDNQSEPAAGRRTSVPNDPAGASKLTQSHATSPFSKQKITKRRKRFNNTVIQRGITDLSETNMYDSEIYGITDEQSFNKNKVIYVGQTTQDWFERFRQHTEHSSEKDQPWHIDNYTYDQTDSRKWRFKSMQLWQCKQYTPLEITASEEYYYEEYGGLEDKLCNRKQPLTKSTFKSYKDNYLGTFRGKTIGFKDNWEPKA